MQRVLVIQTAFLGDAILGTSLLELIHAKYPDCHLDYLVRKGNEGLFVGHPFLNKVLVFDKSRKFLELCRLVDIIRNNSYDVVFNAQRFASSGVLTVLSGAHTTVGYDRNPMSFLFDVKVKYRSAADHEIDRVADLFASMQQAMRALPRLYPSDDDEAVATAYVKRPFIAVAPASVWFTKQWPEAKWVEFIGQIPASVNVVLTGGAGDVPLCERISMSSSRSVAVLAGKLSLLQTAALMRQAGMNYANDSAPVHLASAVNAPICEVFCSTVPTFGFTPLSDVAHTVQTEEVLDCRPCGIHGHRKCPKGHFRCAEIPAKRLLNFLPSS